MEIVKHLDSGEMLQMYLHYYNTASLTPVKYAKELGIELDVMNHIIHRGRLTLEKQLKGDK